MRRIVTAISAAALALSMVSYAMPANAAVPGFDSAYAGESAFLTLNPGQAGTFTVFFANTGTNAWTKGTATQVDLAACLEDKVTCNQQDASEAPFNPATGGWLSATRYATTTQTAVAPGAIGTFTYNVSVPATATGLHRFNGALVVSTTGADVHNEGYYQDVNVPGQQASCTPASITTTPTNAQETVGSTHTQTATILCADGKPSANAAVTFAVQSPVGSLNPNLTLNGTTDSTGKVSVTWSRSNPDTDSVDVFPTAQPNIRASATIFWVVKPVISCTPTTSGTTLNGQSRIFTIALTNPNDGTARTTATAISVGVNPQVTKGTATINGTAVDTSTDANATANTQLTFVTSDANGNATLTVSGTNSTVTPVVWLEETSLGGTNEQAPGTDTVTAAGNHVNKLDTSEFQAMCGTTTFQAVNAVTLAVTPSTAGTVAQSGTRTYTVTATDSAGNPTSAKVNIGFVENLLATTGTSARIVWFDVDAAAADQRSSQASSSSSARQSVCNRVPGGTWSAAAIANGVAQPAGTTTFAGQGTVVTADANGNTLIADATGAVKADRDPGTWTNGNFGSIAGSKTGYPKILGNVMLPVIGRATFAICDEVSGDTATPLVWQDLNATPDFTPETGEPQAQGGTTTFAAPVLTSGNVFSEISGGSDILPATNSAGETGVDPKTAVGFGVDQFTFRMRDQSAKGMFPAPQTGQVAGGCVATGSCAPNGTGTNVGQTVIWTIQNTGSSNVYIVAADGSAIANNGGTITVAPGQSTQLQSPILVSGSDCLPGGRDKGGTNVTSYGGSGEYGQVDCFDSANVVLNAGAATSATISASLVSNGAITSSKTEQWVSALAEPTEPAGVSFTAQGTVVSVWEWTANVDSPDPACLTAFAGPYMGNGNGTEPATASACYYLLQTASGTIYRIAFGSNAAAFTAQSGTVHTSDTYIYLGTQFAGVPICTDSGISYLPCRTLQAGSSSVIHGTPGPANYVACGTIANDCTEEPLAQFIGVLGTGVKLTYTNQTVQGTATPATPTTGTAVHNITATQ